MRVRIVCFVIVSLLLSVFFAGCHSQAVPEVVEGTVVHIPTPDATRLAELSLATAMPTPTRVPPETTAVSYTVRPGDTLSGIATYYGSSIESLMLLNGMSDADQLWVGQVIQVSMAAQFVGPSTLLLPDSEVVYGPEFAAFDIAAATADFPGWFNSYAEDVVGETLSGPEIVQLVAEQYSVGPRVLLAMLELRGGWLTQEDPSPQARLYPLGYSAQEYWDGLYYQLCLAANALNAGFYGWQLDTLWLVQTEDASFVRFAADLNAGTAGVQRALAPGSSDYEAWRVELQRFSAVYRELFGDPFSYAVEPLIPSNLAVPHLELPWSRGSTWYYTSGPHPGWGSLGAWSALDFTTGERSIGCTTSEQWATAAATGTVLISQNGMVLQELDDDNFLGSGWVLLYMHMAADGRVAAGTRLGVGDRVGHPSCEGGVSNATHLHFAWRYNGVWIAADDARLAMQLSGWSPLSDGTAYDGTLVKGSDSRTACECWEYRINGVYHR